MAAVHALYVCTGFKSTGQICNAPARCWQLCAGAMKLITCLTSASQVSRYLFLQGLHILVKFSVCFMMTVLFLFCQTSIIQKNIC